MAGVGIAYLPDFLSQPHLDSGALIPIMTRFPPAEAGLYVIRSPSRHPARKVRVLAELLSEAFGEDSARGGTPGEGRSRRPTGNSSQGGWRKKEIGRNAPPTLVKFVPNKHNP